MNRRKINRKNLSVARTACAQAAVTAASPSTLLPLGAMLLAGSMGAMAQTTPSAPSTDGKALAPVIVKDKAEAAQGKDSIRATTTTIGKGNQALRDIPQSVTVITEKLIDDRNFNTVKDVLRHTGGISFLAAEGGEEDIRLRGFGLQSTGDVFVDGVRDPAFYERDTFNNDRVEILRGSASMLFGRGSTGGAVNQVNKQARLIDESEVDVSLGSYNYKRITGDFNIRTGEESALRINAMSNTADNNGAGSSIDKRGIAGNYRFGIGTADEFSLGFYHLDNKNGMNYGLPYIAARPGAKTSLNTTISPEKYYGLSSDHNNGEASYVTLGHTHRFSADSELKTVIRKGSYERDQRASLIRFSGATPTLLTITPNTVFSRGVQNKMQDMDNLYLQSDYSGKHKAFGLNHSVLAGVDYAREERKVYALGGTPAKPNTRVGTPNDGAWVDEGARTIRTNNQYVSKGIGVYAQDLVEITPQWKVLGGLRYDKMSGDYTSFPAAGAPTSYQMNIGEWSKRVGVLYQPDDTQSYYASYGTSFNTSGEAYSLSASNANTPPESSGNFEIGGRLESNDKRFSTRVAVFRSTKYHERNTDPLLPGITVLSAKRHASGLEIDVSGRLTPQWEVWGSYMWIPIATIDKGVVGGLATGSRNELTPKHSGTVWSTYQILPKLRIGGGINFRSSQNPNRNPANVEVHSYVTADVMAEYAVIEDKFIIKGNINNITDKLYGDALYSAFYVPGAGRTYQVSAKYKF